MSVKKAIIPAAGFGTRFLPATKSQPKEMLPIVDKPTIQYIVEEAVASGIEDIIIVTGRNKRAIEDHFDHSIELEIELEKKEKYEVLEMIQSISSLVKIHYVRQKKMLGLGHAIACAESFIHDEPFAVLLGDDIVRSEKPALLQLIDHYNTLKAPIVGVQPFNPSELHKYGVIRNEQIGNGHHLIKEVIEKPKTNPPSNLAVMGRYILTPEIIEILKYTQPGVGNEIQLADAFNKYVGLKRMYAVEFEGSRYDIGDKLGYLKATVEFALEREDIGENFLNYIKELMVEKENDIFRLVNN